MVSNINYVSKYYIKKEINLLMMKITILRQNYIIFKQLKFKDGCANIQKVIPRAIQYISTALLDKIIIELSKLVVDINKDDLCINSFIRKYEENKKHFKEQKYIYVKEFNTGKRHRHYLDTNEIEKDFEDLENFLKTNVYIRNFLKKTRDKRVAHNDKRMSFDSKYLPIELKQRITYDEISKYIDGLFNKMNQIYFTLFKTQYAPYFTDAYNELNYLNEILGQVNNDKNK